MKLINNRSSSGPFEKNINSRKDNCPYHKRMNKWKKENILSLLFFFSHPFCPSPPLPLPSPSPSPPHFIPLPPPFSAKPQIIRPDFFLLKRIYFKRKQILFEQVATQVKWNKKEEELCFFIIITCRIIY